MTRVKVKGFEFGKTYEIVFYGASGWCEVLFSRKNKLFVKDMGYGNKFYGGSWISKREFKKLYSKEDDYIQWIMEKK
jgi:hypothetical protein